MRYAIAAAEKVIMRTFHLLNRVRSLKSMVLLCQLSIFAAVPPLWALNTLAPPAGIAWRVKGIWQIGGTGATIQTGDRIQPGALLRPDLAATPHSIIILLPDGQSIGYSCFTADDCARGFRVPDLYRDPEPSAVEMLARIRSVLIARDFGFSASSDKFPPSGLPRDEILAVFDPDNQVNVKGLAAKLPNGHFTCDIRPVHPSRQSQFRVLLEKSGPSINLRLPSAGLYVVTIYDEQNNPRIRLFLAAVSPAREANFRKPFNDARDRLQQWNDDWNNDFGGWPIHDFQWAFLESLIASPRLTGDSWGESMPKRLGSSEGAASGLSPPNVTAEPIFSPRAGLLAGETNIVLRSETPGATIHYTLDTSDPSSNSPVYRAPIVIRHGGLIVKAFAAVKGKKDSAVVTGSFRIRN
jgi:hypothetical protein